MSTGDSHDGSFRVADNNPQDPRTEPAPADYNIEQDIANAQSVETRAANVVHTVAKLMDTIHQMKTQAHPLSPADRDKFIREIAVPMGAALEEANALNNTNPALFNGEPGKLLQDALDGLVTFVKDDPSTYGLFTASQQEMLKGRERELALEAARAEAARAEAARAEAARIEAARAEAARAEAARAEAARAQLHARAQPLVNVADPSARANPYLMEDLLRRKMNANTIDNVPLLEAQLRREMRTASGSLGSKKSQITLKRRVKAFRQFKRGCCKLLRAGICCSNPVAKGLHITCTTHLDDEVTSYAHECICMHTCIYAHAQKLSLLFFSKILIPIGEPAGALETSVHQAGPQPQDHEGAVPGHAHRGGKGHANQRD